MAGACFRITVITVRLAVKRLLKVTLTEVECSLRWIHKTFGKMSRRLQPSGRLWLEVDERMNVAEWLVGGCTLMQGCCLHVNAHLNTRRRKMEGEKARQRSSVGITVHRGGLINRWCLIRLAWTNALRCRAGKQTNRVKTEDVSGSQACTYLFSRYSIICSISCYVKSSSLCQAVQQNRDTQRAKWMCNSLMSRIVYPEDLSF